MKLRVLCDSIFDARELKFSNFEEAVLQVLGEANDDYIRYKSEFDRLDKLAKKLREIIVIVHLFPIELKIAMCERSYGSVLREFLALYLNVKALLAESQRDSETFINEAIREVFLILGSDDEASIWMVIAKSSVFEYSKFLQALIDISLLKTRRTQFTFEQYISLVGVIYKYFCVDENAKRPLILETISTFSPPKGIGKYLTHHFSARDWGETPDVDVHKQLFVNAQPKSFVRDLGKKICLEGFDKINFTGCDTLVFDNKTKNEEIKASDKEVNGEVDEYQKTHVEDDKLINKSKKKKKKKRSGDDSRESGASKKSRENDVLQAFYAAMDMRDAVIVLQRVRV